MKNFELIKAGQPSEVEILTEYSMNNILGGCMEKCNKGYEDNWFSTKCACGYDSGSAKIV